MTTLKHILKSLDAFKVDATFIVPRSSKKGESSYVLSFGSLPGFCFTLIASLLSMIYLIPMWHQMNSGSLDLYSA
jgi:hypothetical protein